MGFYHSRTTATTTIMLKAMIIPSTLSRQKTKPSNHKDSQQSDITAFEIPTIVVYVVVVVVVVIADGIDIIVCADVPSESGTLSEIMQC